MSDVSQVKLRRNGRQPACEPCRQRKVSCDHKQPVCSRCRSSETANECIYLPQQPVKRRKAAHIRQLGRSLAGSPAAPAAEPLTPPTNSEAFLGVTNYKYVMNEAQSKMTPDSWTDTAEPEVGRANEANPLSSRIMTDDRTVEAALRVLRNIPQRSLAKDLFHAYTNPNDGWCRLAVRWLHDSFWQTFGAVLDGDRSTKSLVPLATQLCDNSSRPLREDYTDPKEWFASFSKHNMRWEGLGILFTHWAFGALALSLGPVGLKCQSGHYAPNITEYKRCAWDTIEVTRNTASANTLLLYLLYKQGCLESNVTGDDSLQHARLHGEATSLLIYLGLHTVGGDLQDRGICTQIKRRLFGRIFHGDKAKSTFSGWPPMLSRRFTSTALPLDISDETLLGVAPWRDDMVDENGWNTLGEIYPTTLLRARSQLGFIRETILGNSLQVAEGMSKQDLRDLDTIQEETICKFPRWLLLDSDEVDNRKLPGTKLYAKLLIRLEYLQNRFFIERQANKLENVTLSTRLIQVSTEIVSLTLVFWTHKDRMLAVNADIAWLVLGFASPAAGILCLELLRQDTLEDASTNRSFSRSELVQKLSLLRGLLDWIKPLNVMPNRNHTNFVGKVIERVLDQTLNAPRDFSLGMGNWGQELELGFGEDLELGAATNDFAFDLLDTFDWLRPDQSDVK